MGKRKERERRATETRRDGNRGTKIERLRQTLRNTETQQRQTGI